MTFSQRRPNSLMILMGSATLLLAAGCHPAAAQYATLSLQSQPGDYIGQGQNFNILYTPASNGGLFAAQVRRTEANGLPGEIDFVLNNPGPENTFALLFFGTDQLGIPLQPGTYTDAQRADFAAPGHAGLDVSFQNRGSNTLTGNFKVTDFTYTMTAPDTFVIDTFDATFEQHSEGEAPALFGEFSYRNTGTPPVPEASTTVSLGLLLFLGGIALAVRRRKVVTGA